MRPFLPRSVPHKDEFVERNRLRDHPEDIVNTRGFFTADYLRFPPDMTGITMYMNEHMRLYAFQVHSPSNPQLTTVDKMDSLKYPYGRPHHPVRLRGGTRHFPIHAPAEYITKVTIRVLAPRQRVAVDLGVEVSEGGNPSFKMLTKTGYYQLETPYFVWF